MAMCEKKTCVFYYITILANVALISMCFYIATDIYDERKYIILLIALPPALSLIALRKGGDKEERALKKRIRKALLRKELDTLKDYDKAD